MIIDGKLIAEEILLKLKNTITAHHIAPKMTAITVGDDPKSLSYLRQKQNAADKIGIQMTVNQLPLDTHAEKLKEIILENNQDKLVHGIIIQRPVPKELNIPDILNLVDPQKDIDGFVPGTKYIVPVAEAVGILLENIYKQTCLANPDSSNTVENYFNWLLTKQICIVGRGDTAGKPIADYFQNKQFLSNNSYQDTINQNTITDNQTIEDYKKSLVDINCATSIIHSSTPEPEAILRQADIIISCVGNGYTIKPTDIKQDVILISVGIWKDEDSKLHGDYDEAKIYQIASFYTPTPGGVGPINVACLMQNLIKSAITAKT